MGEVTKGKANWDNPDNILNLYKDFTGEQITSEREAKIKNVKRDWLNREEVVKMFEGLMIVEADRKKSKKEARNEG